jgi:hypothetical protein
MKQIANCDAIRLLAFMTRILCAVGGLALIFTTVNVTHFATSRNVPWPIALLLDPMIGITLTGVLYVDAHLASWHIRPPAWSTALRWSAGCTAALMNTWDSLWPDRQIGWPHHADPAAVLLHLTPALLLIALTETIAAYRKTITNLTNQIDTSDPPQHPTSSPNPPRSAAESTDRSTADPAPPSAEPREPGSDLCSSTSGIDHHPPAIAGDRAQHQLVTADHAPIEESTTEDDMWPHAVALDVAARSATGKPVSVWQLRTHLRIGPKRARQIRDQLLTRQPTPPPTT